jgi:pimeloyl-ACP methyl ester carboxylesterase
VVIGWVESDVAVGDGVVLHVRRTGSVPERQTGSVPERQTGSGGPVLLAHGLLDDGGCWERVGDVLARDHDVVAYDARYHGRTREPAGARWGGADDLVALNDALGLERAVVMGHSMGAVTAAQALAEHPTTFRAGVLEDPAWMAMPRDPAALEAGRAAFRQMLEGSEEEIAALGRQFSPTWDDREFAPWARAKASFHGVDHLEAGLAHATATRWQDVVARFRVPVLLVCGGNAAAGRIVTPEIAAEAAQLCPTLEVATFPDAGHNVRREAFDGYVAAVTEFLARV